MNENEISQIISKYSPEILKYESENITNFLIDGGLDRDILMKKINIILNQKNYKNIDIDIFKIALDDLIKNFIDDKIPPYFLIENLKILKINFSSYILKKKKILAAVVFDSGITLILPSKIENDQNTIDMLKHELKHIASYYKRDNYSKSGLITKNNLYNKSLNEVLIDTYAGRNINKGYHDDNFKIYPILQLLKEEVRKDIYSCLFLGEFTDLINKYPFISYMLILLKYKFLDQTEIIPKIEFLLEKYKPFFDYQKLEKLQDTIFEYYKPSKSEFITAEIMRLELFDIGIKKLQIKYNLSHENKKRILIIKKEEIENKIEMLREEIGKLTTIKNYYINFQNSKKAFKCLLPFYLLILPFGIPIGVAHFCYLQEYFKEKNLNSKMTHDTLLNQINHLILNYLYYQIQLNKSEINELIEKKNKIKK